MFGYIIVKNPAIPSPPAPPHPQPFCQPSRNFVRSTLFWFTLFCPGRVPLAKSPARATVFSPLNFSQRMKSENFLQKQPVVHFATPESSGYMVCLVTKPYYHSCFIQRKTYSTYFSPAPHGLTIPIVSIPAAFPSRPPSKRRTLWRRTFFFFFAHGSAHGPVFRAVFLLRGSLLRLRRGQTPRLLYTEHAKPRRTTLLPSG